MTNDELNLDSFTGVKAVRKFQRLRLVIWGGLTGALLLVAASCPPGTATTVLLANFASDALGGPPSQQQAIGTVSSTDGAGTVRVVSAPPGSSGKWAEINHPNAPAPETIMLCNFAQSGPASRVYAFLAVFYIPTGCQVATLEFDTGVWGSPPNQGFFHLDFMPSNTVRLDDGSTTFGTFPRDQVFTVSVQIDARSSTPIAHLLLNGSGASGSLDYNLQTPFLAQQIGAVRIWMGYQWKGHFDVSQILVTSH